MQSNRTIKMRPRGSYLEKERASKKRREDKKARIASGVQLWNAYAGPGPHIEWNKFPGNLLPWQEEFETWVVHAFRDEGKHGAVLCAPPGLGKSFAASLLVGACDAERPCVVVMPGSLKERWKEMLLLAGVDKPRIRDLTPSTTPPIPAGTVFLASLESFTARDWRCLPSIALLVLDERMNIGEKRAAMLGRVVCQHVLSISADPPNSVGCWIIGNGQRRDDLIYTRDMYVVDDDASLPSVREHDVCIRVPDPTKSYRTIADDYYAYEHSFHRLSDDWENLKIERAIRDALASGKRTLIYVRRIPTIAAREKLIAEVFPDAGLTLSDMLAVGTDITPDRRGVFFENMAKNCPRFCFVTPAVASVGINLSFFDAIALCTPIFSKALYTQIVGRVRRHGAEEKDVYCYYAGGTHEDLSIDRRYDAQLPGEPLGRMRDWIRDWTEQQAARALE